MTTDTFWKIIGEVHRESGGDMDLKCSLLKERLLSLGEEELREFGEQFDDAIDAADRWELWATAFLMKGGCANDVFCDFRASLISMGRRTHELAIIDPEWLADQQPESADYLHGGIRGAIQEAEVLRGIQRPRKPYPGTSIDLTDDEWWQDIELLFPRLWARVGTHDAVE